MMRALWAVVMLIVGACGDDGSLGSGSGWSGSSPPCDDTADDPYNCGSCGHTCWGGSCEAGVCQAVQLQLGDNVVIDEDVILGGGAEVRVTKLATHLAIDAPFVEMADVVTERRFALDHGVAYWTGADGIYRCPVEGGCEDHPEHIYTEAPLMNEQGMNQLAYAAGFTIAGGSVFVSRLGGIVDVNKTIEMCAVDSCTSLSTIYSVPYTTYISKLVSDGTNLAWFQDVGVWACTANNCAATAHQITTNALLQNARTFPLVLKDGTLVWADLTSTSPFNSRVMTCQLPACTPTPVLDVGDATYDLYLHGDRVYVNAANGIVSVPITGGAPEPVPVAPYYTTFYASDAFYVLGTGKVAR